MLDKDGFVQSKGERIDMVDCFRRTEDIGPIAGILDVKGTKAAPVTIRPEIATGGFQGVYLLSGSEARYAYAEQWGAGITTNGTSKLTVTFPCAVCFSGVICRFEYAKVV